MYLSANSNSGLFKADLHLYVEYYVNEVIKTIWLVNMLIILLLTLWYATIQYRKGELRWIFFVYTFFKTNYIWILLWCVTFRMQVEIDLYVMSPTLESFNRPFMRLWFYAAFIQIEFESSVRSYASRRHRRKRCVLFTYLWIKYKNKKEKRKERSIRRINPFKLIKGFKVRGRVKRENKFHPLQYG